MKSEKEAKIREIAERYNIDLEKLKKEQVNLARNLNTKDSIDFSKVVKVGGISNVFFQNKIISAAVVIDNEFNIIEQKYFSDKAKFPYIPGLRAYRELPAMVECFNSIDEKPEVVFIQGHGVSHERLGIASHFSLSTGIPSIGIADSAPAGEIKNDEFLKNGKVVGKVLQTKIGSKPVYVSPGNMISLKSAVELTERFTKKPYKLPEPLRISHKYAKEVMREIFSGKD